MSKEFDNLKRDYRNVVAPSHLRTRINASVADTRVRSNAWMPATVSLTAIVAIFWIAPMAWLEDDATPAAPSKPSLSALAALTPSKPSMSMPGLSRVRSVNVPRTPTKPKLMPSATKTAK